MNYIFQHKQVQSSFGSFFAEIAQPNSSMFELKSHLLINAKNTHLDQEKVTKIKIPSGSSCHQHHEPVTVIKAPSSVAGFGRRWNFSKSFLHSEHFVVLWFLELSSKRILQSHQKLSCCCKRFSSIINCVYDDVRSTLLLRNNNLIEPK